MNDKKLNNKPVIRINPALIPKEEMKLLAMTFLEGISQIDILFFYMI